MKDMTIGIGHDTAHVDGKLKELDAGYAKTANTACVAALASLQAEQPR